MSLNKNSKIFLAGHNGLVGSSILRYLKNKKYTKILTVDKNKLDLTNQQNTEKYL
jgi:GDP-L-fucose synthase